MSPVAIELHNELLSGRLLDPEYMGVVFAPVEEHGELIKIIKSTLNGTFNEKRKEFRTQEGARLQVADVDSDDSRYRYADSQLTTVIIQTNALVSNEWVIYPSGFIMYMNNRLRTKANMHTRLVLC